MTSHFKGLEIVFVFENVITILVYLQPRIGEWEEDLSTFFYSIRNLRAE